jgi:CBS domain-containing protein
MGIVSKSDLLQRHQGGRARDVMMPLVFSLAETATVGQAAALMAAEGIHRVVVTARDGSLLGIVSSLDVMRWLAEREGWLIKP